MSNNRSGRTPYVLRILTILCLTAAAVCAFMVVRELYTRRQGRELYTTLSDIVGSSQRSARRISAGELPAIENESPSSETPSLGPGASEQVETESVWVPYVDFDAARERVPDIAAWIRCEGTPIDYPVVQGDDNYYYLNHLPNKKYNQMGSIYFDYRNATDFTGKNTIIYGHHMKTGEMFSALEFYKKQSFYDEHPVIEIYTQDNDYLVEVFAGCVISGDIESLPLEFDGEDAFEAYVKELRRSSVIKSNIEIGPDDRLVTLCTCTYNFSNARFLLVGKLTVVGK